MLFFYYLKLKKEALHFFEMSVTYLAINIAHHLKRFELSYGSVPLHICKGKGVP